MSAARPQARRAGAKTKKKKKRWHRPKTGPYKDSIVPLSSRSRLIFTPHRKQKNFPGPNSAASAGRFLLGILQVCNRFRVVFSSKHLFRKLLWMPPHISCASGDSVILSRSDLFSCSGEPSLRRHLRAACNGPSANHSGDVCRVRMRTLGWAKHETG